MKQHCILTKIREILNKHLKHFAEENIVIYTVNFIILYKLVDIDSKSVYIGNIELVYIDSSLSVYIDSTAFVYIARRKFLYVYNIDLVLLFCFCFFFSQK